MKPLLLTFVLSCGVDASQTHYGLLHGATETFLPTQNPWVADGLMAGEAVAGAYALDRLSRSHPTASKRITWILIGARFVAIAWNAHQLLK